MNNQDNFINRAQCAQLASLMNQKYRQYLDDGRQFSIECSKNADQLVWVTTTLANPKGTFVYPVEARVAYVDEELEAAEAALFLVDYIDTYFEEFFLEQENLFIPIDWTATTYEAIDFHIKGQVHNQALEKAADQLLKDAGFFQEPQLDGGEEGLGQHP